VGVFPRSRPPQLVVPTPQSSAEATAVTHTIPSAPTSTFPLSSCPDPSNELARIGALPRRERVLWTPNTPTSTPKRTKKDTVLLQRIPLLEALIVNISYDIESSAFAASLRGNSLGAFFGNILFSKKSQSLESKNNHKTKHTNTANPGVTFSNAVSKLKAQSSNVSFH